MLHRARVLVVCAAVLAAVFPSAAHAACNPGFGATYNVSDPTDSEVGQPPVQGSLRYVVAHASPGSVIGFCENFLIKLNSPIRIPEEKAGLQFLGPSTIGEAPAHVVGGEQTDPNGEFIVNAENVVFRGLSFTNVNIGASYTADGLKVLGNQFSVLNPDRDGKGAAIELEGRDEERLRGVQIGSEAEPNLIQSSQEAAIASFRTQGLQIVGNTIDTSAGSFAIDDEDGRKLLVRANTVSGAFNGDVESGRIVDNSFTAKKHIYAIRVYAKLDRFGHVTVERNTVTGGGNIRLERDAVDVLRNTVTGARQPGIHARCNSGIGDSVGPTRIEANVLEANDFGLLYQCGRSAAPGVIKGNSAKGNRKVGLGIQGTRITVDDNGIEGNRTQGIAVNAPWGAVELSRNKVFGNRGVGVEFKARSRASITAGTVHDNGSAGARVDHGALVRISRVAFARNAGPGIDLLPVGVTPNGTKKPENHNLDWPVPAYNPKKGKIEGTTCARCLVEAFTVEGGGRAGNPRNGEGAAFLAAAPAKADGRFGYPARGKISCAEARKVTFTATEGGKGAGVTSEFSPDVKCDPGSTTPPNETTPSGCAGDATATVTIRDENFDGLAETSFDTEIPPNCDIGLRSDGRTGRSWSMRVYDAADSSKLYFCHDGTDPPPGEAPCSSPQPTNPPDSDVTGSIVKENGAWRLYIHLNTRQSNFSLTVRAHYGWKGS